MARLNVQVNGSGNVVSSSSANGSSIVINGESVHCEPGEEFHGLVGGTEVHISGGNVYVGNRVSRTIVETEIQETVERVVEEKIKRSLLRMPRWMR